MASKSLGRLIVESVTKMVLSDAEKAATDLRDQANSVAARNRADGQVHTVETIVGDTRYLDRKTTDAPVKRLVDHQVQQAQQRTERILDGMGVVTQDESAIPLDAAAKRRRNEQA